MTPTRWQRLWARVAVAVLVLALSGCTFAVGGRGRVGPPGRGAGGSPASPPPSAASGEQPTAKVLTSDDLFTIYRSIMTTYVDQVDDGVPLLGALQGARAAGIDLGLLPVETAVLDTLPLELTGDPQSDWAPFGDAYDVLLKKVGPRTDLSGVGRAAAQGMLKALRDPLTEYLDLDAMRAMQTSKGASIGVVLSPAGQGRGPMVREVLPNGPAEQAGIRVGDRIAAIDGKPAGDTDLYDILQALGGADGSSVTVTIGTVTGESREVSLQRATISLNAVAVERRDGVAYVRLRAFDQGVTNTVRRELAEASASGATGWLVDVRGNGEGSLQEAASVASLFVGTQSIAVQEDRSAQRATLRGTGEPLSPQLPLVVLLDGATAGPAELLAAAVHDYQAGTIVGTPTAGRLGTTTAVGLSDGSAAVIASSRMLGPSGGRLLGAGVQPNDLIEPDAAAAAAGRDLPLERALALLQ